MAIWLALGGAAISAIGSGVSSNNASRGQEQLRGQQLAAIDEGSAMRQSLIEQALSGTFNGFGMDAIFGSKVEPTNLQESQLKAVLANQANFGEINDLTQTVNEQISEDMMRRAEQFDPNFSTNVALMSDQARSFLRGEIPEDVYDLTVRNRAGATNQVGIPGTAGPATARDLGLTTLDLQQRGSSIFQQINNVRDQTDPLSRRLSQTQFLVDPTTQLAVDQANAIIAAMPDPGASGLFGLELQGNAFDTTARGQVGVAVNNTAGNALGALGADISQIPNFGTSYPTLGGGRTNSARAGTAGDSIAASRRRA